MKSTAPLPRRPAPTTPPRPRPRPGARIRGEVVLPPPPRVPAEAAPPTRHDSANRREPLLRAPSWLPRWLGGGLALGWVRHILRAGEPYLDRFSLRRQGPSGTNPWRVYLHRFLAPDAPGHHNHPSAWSFSIVLWGSYTEEILEPAWHYRDGSHGALLTHMPTRVRRRRVRWFNWIDADRYHRIAELHPGPGARGVWTLFVCGPLTGRGWGFWRDGRHVPVEAGH
jgi:hypothetical protein